MFRCWRPKFQKGRKILKNKRGVKQRNNVIARLDSGGGVGKGIQQRGASTVIDQVSERKTSLKWTGLRVQARRDDVRLHGEREHSSHLKTAQMITEPEGLDDHGGSFPQRVVTERTDFLATYCPGSQNAQLRLRVRYTRWTHAHGFTAWVCHVSSISCWKPFPYRLWEHPETADYLSQRALILK